ncbi:L,D-transpeptidase [Sulfitobacter sp. S190]|uniref:L,D-transpeptidase n=1 Tax=Sulfitobacter sp. S190 TaxID=2867022 RepID=UPI0021A428F0|nr:L,D-transpeptidase [Sulfitobacter sp. S190]UWR23408.1 L,D-transpeptidase [Sulfitobacter sp. S190]
MTEQRFSRRRLIAVSGAALAVPAVARAQDVPAAAPLHRRNTMSFVPQNWQDHFDGLGIAAIVADTTSRALHFWSGDGETYKVYPTSVPRTDELTKRGYTEIVRKRVGPDWTPTPNMLKEDPTLEYMPPGPGNPLGTHAMYLSWPAYLIHGTHDTRKIGRQSSSGCIGLYNHMVEELFAMAPVGTQVRII